MSILDNVLKYHLEDTGESLRFYPHGLRLQGYQLPRPRTSAVRKYVKIMIVLMVLAQIIGFYLLMPCNSSIFVIYSIILFAVYSAAMELVARFNCQVATKRPRQSNLDSEIKILDTGPIYKSKIFILFEIITGIILFYILLLQLYKGSIKDSIIILLLIIIFIFCHFVIRKFGRR